MFQVELVLYRFGSRNQGSFIPNQTSCTEKIWDGCTYCYTPKTYCIKLNCFWKCNIFSEVSQNKNTESSMVFTSALGTAVAELCQLLVLQQRWLALWFQLTRLSWALLTGLLTKFQLTDSLSHKRQCWAVWRGSDISEQQMLCDRLTPIAPLQQYGSWLMTKLGKGKGNLSCYQFWNSRFQLYKHPWNPSSNYLELLKTTMW